MLALASDSGVQSLQEVECLTIVDPDAGQSEKVLREQRSAYRHVSGAELLALEKPLGGLAGSVWVIMSVVSPKCPW